jgi:mannose-6-phosphate isomerase-like protein (cupin superfamily)
MAAYTHKNLRDVKNSAPEFGIEGGFEARFARRDLEAERTGLAYQHMPPDTQAPFGHRHQEAEEIYVVVEGSGKMKLGDEVIDVGLLDAVRVAPEVPRAFAAGSEGLTVIALGAHHENDGEVIPDFWDEG